jgi:hypothetical protein
MSFWVVPFLTMVESFDPVPSPLGFILVIGMASPWLSCAKAWLPINRILKKIKKVKNNFIPD